MLITHVEINTEKGTQAADGRACTVQGGRTGDGRLRLLPLVGVGVAPLRDSRRGCIAVPPGADYRVNARHSPDQKLESFPHSGLFS